MLCPTSVHTTLIGIDLDPQSAFLGGGREMEEGESHRGDEAAPKVSERKRKSQKRWVF